MFNIVNSEHLLGLAKLWKARLERNANSEAMFILFVILKTIEDYVIHEGKADQSLIKKTFGDDLYNWMSFLGNKQKHVVIDKRKGSKKTYQMDQSHKERVESIGALNTAPLNSHAVNDGRDYYYVNVGRTEYEMCDLAGQLITKWELLIK